MTDHVVAPGRWDCDVLTADGRPLHLRPIRPEDADGLVAFHERLSPRSVYYRFFSAHPHLTDGEVERFTRVDHANREALVVLDGDRLVAVGRYDRRPATTSAEVAFVVDDAYQGRGVATLLIEHLAAIARTRGIDRFTASVLPGNRRMLDVFRSAGLGSTSHFSADVVEITMPLTPTAEGTATVEAREHRSEARSIERLLHPRSVALVGAGSRHGSVGATLLHNLLSGGFEGAVHAVSHTGGQIAGRPVHRSVLDIPDPVDLAVVAVPATAVEQVVEDCAAKGVAGLVIVAAGFAEADGATEGADRQRRIVELARRHGMRIVGPNCIGIADTAVGLDATFAPFRPSPGNVACLSQSGALGIALLERCNALGLGVSSFVSVGNKADVSGNDLLQYWEDDPATDVVALYLESFGNPRKFARIARRVSRTKPIVALKSGRSIAGQAAARSHTAAMASPDTAVDALFAQAGVIRVDTLVELFDTTSLLAWQPLPTGNRVAVVGNSGGPETMACDAAEAAGLTLATLTAATRDALRGLLPEGPAGRVGNPLDLLAAAGPDQLRTAMRTLLADETVDAVVAVVTPVLLDEATDLVAAIAEGARGAAKPVLAAVLAVPDSPAALRDAHIPWHPSPEAAMHALGRVTRYAAWRRRDPGTVPSYDDVHPDAARLLVSAALTGAAEPHEGAPEGEGRWLTPVEAGELLAAYGIPVAPTVFASTADAAVARARDLGYPVALKTADPDLVHKTDVGAVHLGLDDADQVRAAAHAIDSAVGPRGGYVVQPMADPGVELIAGITHDPAFGPLVLFGAGGIDAELAGDRTCRLTPLTDHDAADAVRSLRRSPLLFGYRGRPPVAVDRLEDLLLRLARLADDHPEIAEADLNPVIATPTGAIAVDAKIRLTPAGDTPPPLLRRLR